MAYKSASDRGQCCATVPRSPPIELKFKPIPYVPFAREPSSLNK
jgi:hypothetical protein